MPDSSERFCYALKINNTFLSVGGFPNPNKILIMNSDSIGVSSHTKDEIVSAFFNCVPSSRVPANECKVYVYKCPCRKAPLEGKCVYCPQKGACIDPTSKNPNEIL